MDILEVYRFGQIRYRGVARAKSLGWPYSNEQNFGVTSNPKLSSFFGFILRILNFLKNIGMAVATPATPV